MDKRFVIENEMDELGRLRNEIEQVMLDQGFDQGCRADVQLICEEILCNIVSYGFPKHDHHSMELQFRTDGELLTLEFIDDGIAFDPLNCAEPELDDPEAEDRPVGGLGIYLVKQLTDQQRYERRAGKNHLTVIRSVSLLKD